MWSREIEVDQLVSRPSGVQTQFMYYKYNYSIQQKNNRSHNDEDIGIYEGHRYSIDKWSIGVKA